MSLVIGVKRKLGDFYAFNKAFEHDYIYDSNLQYCPRSGKKLWTFGYNLQNEAKFRLPYPDGYEYAAYQREHLTSYSRDLTALVYFGYATSKIDTAKEISKHLEITIEVLNKLNILDNTFGIYTFTFNGGL